MAMFRGDETMDRESAETTVGTDVTVKGNLKSPSNIMVNGTVKGKVDTKADVTIGEGAMIEGSVRANKVTISGTVQGNVEGRENIEVTPSGKIYGDIQTSNLVIQSGAIFVGKSMMAEKEGEKEEGEEKKEEESGEEEVEMQEKEAEEVLQ